MSEEKFSYEQTKHLFDPDMDGGKCQHVWRLQANPVNWHQITRVCVICHTSSGFPDAYDFLRGNYTNAENANLGHYLQVKQLEQRLADATALLAELSLVEGQEGWEPATPEAGPSYCFYCGGAPDEAGRADRFTFRHAPDCTWQKLRAFLAQ